MCKVAFLEIQVPEQQRAYDVDALTRGEIEACVGPARVAARVGRGTCEQHTLVGATIIL